MFKKASKKQLKLRLLLEGVSGSGKTFSALRVAKAMGKKIAVIDTEKGSASLYSDRFEFDCCELAPPYKPEAYVEAIRGAEKAGYDVLIIDSISHEWSGDGGCLDIQSKLGGRYQDWAKVTPRHQAFIEAILQSSMHIIATARSKSDFAMVTENGKTKVEKLGMKTEQRDGLEFEFTTVLRINQNHMFEASKDRTNLFDGAQDILTEKHGKKLMDWLESGEPEKLASEFNIPAAVVAEPEKDWMPDIKACKTPDELVKLWHKMPADKQKYIDTFQSHKKALLEIEEDFKKLMIKEGEISAMIEVPQ